MAVLAESELRLEPIGVNRTIYMTFDPSLDASGFPTDAGNNPLTHISVEVQQQVANRVFIFTTTDPHLFVRQLDKALLDVGRELLQPVRRISEE